MRPFNKALVGQAIVFCGLWAAAAQAQSFEVASVKPSKTIIGHDGSITTDPARFSARNAPLKRLIFEAWQIPYSQIVGGPSWLNTDEYDIEAKPDAPATVPQLRLMLRTLLAERFKLATRIEKKEGRIYALVVNKNGPKLEAPSTPRSWKFHGDLSEFANILAIQLTIPFSNDPTIPSRAAGPPIPVVNKTGIAGVFNLSVDIKPEPGGDAFTLWQRALQEQLGLRLESQKGSIDILVVEHAERIPTGN